MSTPGPSRATGPSAKKANARAKAAAAREAQRRAERRRRLVLAIVAGAVVVGVIVTLVLVVLQSRDDDPASGSAAGPAGSQDAAIVEGSPSAPVRVDVFQDYMCPGCGGFHMSSGHVLTEEAEAGTAQIHFHPASFLDRFSQGTQYSTRSANAAACASDAGVFAKYNDLLFANQPAENTPGLDDDRLIALGTEAGATDPAFATCVTERTYGDWIAYVTDQAFKSSVSSTPTVRVDGTTLRDLSPDGLRKAIQDAAAAQ